MASQIILLIVAATLLTVIVAMIRQREDGSTAQRPAPTPDPWNGSSTRTASGTVVTSRPNRDADAVGREVMEHLRRLEERASPGLTAQVMPVFLKDTAARLVALREAVDRKDGPAAHRIVHTLHGSAATVGASSMVSNCADMIREVRVGAFDRCDGLIAELTFDFEAIQRAVAAEWTRARE